MAETCSGASAFCPADAFAPSTSTCRASAGTCDAAEKCTGASAACPADAFAPPSTTCRASAGTCDAAEKCSGASASCPADAFAPPSTVCRFAAGACDADEMCSGSSGTCPTDVKKPSGTVCRTTAGTCDLAETCNGTADSCPNDTFASASTTCRASAGTCDAAEKCTGSSAACPVDAFAPSSTVCRDPNGACDVAETCTGSAASCPADVFAGPSTVCRSAAGACDAGEMCSGSSGTCPTDVKKPSGTVCRTAAGTCDLAETCNGTADSCPNDTFASASTVCRASAGECDVPETCTGSAAACPADVFATSATSCRPAVIVCDAPEACTGSSAACPADASSPAGTSCGANSVCTSSGECAVQNDAPVVNAGADQTLDLQQGRPTPNFTLQRISTAFNNPIGIEYHPILNKMVMSVNCCSGWPHNFDVVNADGSREPYTTITGLTDEVYFAIARDEGDGRSRGGFIAGEMVTGTGVPGQIARISPDGSSMENPWVVLPGESGRMRGQLQFDRTGVFGGDLIVTTTAGHLWRVTSAGEATFLATLVGDDLEGLTVVPNDPDRYGPWAGKILVGDEDIDAVYAVDAAGQVTTYHLGIRPENIMIVPPGENFYGVDYYGNALMGASASQFKDMVGDILIAEEFGGILWHIHWNSLSFDKTRLAQVQLWEHTSFGPAPLAEIGQSFVDVALSGTATDDGRPTGSTLTSTWSVLSGPGIVSFADGHAVSTTARLVEPGTYVLRLTATDGTLTTTDDVTITIRRITPQNAAPVASAGPDQTIRIPDVVVVAGSASDDGVPIGSAISLSWTQVSGPAPVVFGNSSAGITPVLFVEPGTYVLQLDARDGELTGSDQVTITVNPEPALAGGSLLVTLSSPGPMPLGAEEVVTATLLDASAMPIARFPVQVTVAGANPGLTTLITDMTGTVVLPYTGSHAGTDALHATATGLSSSLDSATVSVAWVDIPIGAPLLTQGWIASPIHQSTIMERVPVVLSNQITLTSGTLQYWPSAHPDQPHTIATGLSAGPGTTIGTFDTTLLANGSYILDLSGTDDTGRQRQSEVLVVVDGEYKPGRVVVDITDFTVPLAGLPITIGRRYDSLEKDNVGDFGHGWSLRVGHPKLEKDLANNVTITMPNGRRTTFYFSGNYPVVGPVIIGFLIMTGYTPAPGTYGTLTSDGCPVMTVNLTDDQPRCFGALSPDELLYAPTEYKYTEPNGTVYVMGATGELRSVTDRQGNSLTFQPNGIFSSTGKHVTFVRDGQGRITNVDYPAYFGGEDDAARYQYDAAGDLITVDLAKLPWVFFRTMHHTYDATHRLLTSVDPNGNTARTSTYYADGRLKTDTDALGNVTLYAYDLATRTHTTKYQDDGVITKTFDVRGLVLSQTDQLGHTTTHEYDANWNEIRLVNALGEVTTATYDTFGNATSRTDSTGTITAEYNERHLPVAVVDRLLNRTTFEYDDNGSTSRLADSNGTLFKFTNSEQGLPLIVEDAEGRRARFQYDAAGNPLARIDWLGRVGRATYDEAGHQLTETTARGGNTTKSYHLTGALAFSRDPSGYERGFSYDPNGNLLVAWDNAGRQTNSTYDKLNQLTQTTRWPEGATVTYTRNIWGQPLTMTDENNHTTAYEYDTVGNLTKTTFADGKFTTRTYDVLNRLASITDERGHKTSYEYDEGCGCSDRVTKVTDPLGHATVTKYDRNGRKLSVTDANGRITRNVYDSRGQVVDTIYPDATSVHHTYDARGHLVSTTDQTGVVTARYGYDAQGQATSVTDPLGNATRYAYDLDGNMASVTDAKGHTTTYEYDLLKRMTRRMLPLGQSETFAYDFAGRQIGHTDFGGKTTAMTYDPRDRVLTKVPDPSLGEASHTYTYSLTGRRLTATDGTGTTTYSYDPRDRLLTKAAPAGTLTYTYDPTGNVATIRSSNTNGTSVDYAWDAANQLETIADNRTGGTTRATHTPTNRPLTLVQPNGVGVTYAYDSMERVTSMLWQKGTSPVLGSWAYTHNERGQRLTATDITGRRVEYTYDAAARLTSETISGAASNNGAISYVLDALANRVSRTSDVGAVPTASYSYDANDQLTTDVVDANGNTTGSGGHTYAYDFENHLVSKDGSVTLQYNCDGNRVAKTTGGVTTRYLVDDLNPTGFLQVLEETVGGAVQIRYTYGTSLISQTRNVSATPAISYYGHDAHGNVTFLTNAAGTVTDSYDYDAWGILVGSTGSTPNTRLYAGEELDPDLGFLNLRARQYSPSTGRFLTRDPLDLVNSAGPPDDREIGMVDAVTHPQLRAVLQIAAPDRAALGENVFTPINWNRFLYANADAVNRLDPTGRATAMEYAVKVSHVVLWASSLLHIAELVKTLTDPHASQNSRNEAAGVAICTGIADSVAFPISWLLKSPGMVIFAAIIGLFCLATGFIVHDSH